jgi:3-methyladenine DNA glycosylase AlkD
MDFSSESLGEAWGDSFFDYSSEERAVLPEIFEIAEILLLDSDDLVQKGYGWMLKAASESHPREVYDYLISRKEIMPRTAFLYGLEKMPFEWRQEAMKK